MRQVLSPRQQRLAAGCHTRQLIYSVASGCQTAPGRQLRSACPDGQPVPTRRSHRTIWTDPQIRYLAAVRQGPVTVIAIAPSHYRFSDG